MMADATNATACGTGSDTSPTAAMMPPQSHQQQVVGRNASLVAQAAFHLFPNSFVPVIVHGVVVGRGDDAGYLAGNNAESVALWHRRPDPAQHLIRSPVEYVHSQHVAGGFTGHAALYTQANNFIQRS